ncbi:hypothetical protein Cgig2_031858 [Carnegiea gigantea]|uniref:non-specific serine/threonine protein kinase n=1 Tax=Carnegiea gigantea TaxID=171969 RepID=A0A9Q1KSM0_9CARY|nr:hypothetical protein Cgig2_031858 [Carnegiea gigantea]
MTKLPHNIITFLLVLLLWTTTVNHAECFTLNFPFFSPSDGGKFIVASRSGINEGALQVTRDVRGENITKQSGRILYRKPFKLHKKRNIASFNSTFVLNITPEPDGGGEGLAFILTRDPDVPSNSEAQWLGLVNASSNGFDHSNIVAVEFDTKKSFFEDLDDNHVGLDVNSVYSVKQVSLNNSGIAVASASNMTVMIIYDGASKVMNMSVSMGNRISINANSTTLSQSIDLSQHLPSEVYVGFSASTGIGSELNCLRSWYFTGDDMDKTPPLWILILVPIMSLVLLVCGVGAGYLCWRVKLKQKQAEDDDLSIQGIETGLGPKKFKLKDLKAATSNFNPKNELGRGGFGVVYKGIWGTKEVAVKRIVDTPQGKQNLVAEVLTIGSLHHKNLVELVGWCYESNELLLVYEYMPNGSLDALIDCDGESLSWKRRHSVVCGVAQAVDYLHHECSKRVLHRDIKPSNIMLDSDFNAQLGDFGLARMFKLGEKTRHSTKVLVGTPGYMAPEILHMGRTTAETDVYAFGVLALVVASGRTPWNQNNEDKKHGTNVIDWVWRLHKSNTITNVIDPKLKGAFDKEQAQSMLVLGLACCHPNPYMRPTMRNALQVLMGEATPPLVPFEKPPFMWPVSMPSFVELEPSFDGQSDNTDF